MMRRAVAIRSAITASLVFFLGIKKACGYRCRRRACISDRLTMKYFRMNEPSVIEGDGILRHEMWSVLSAVAFWPSAIEPEARALIYGAAK
jgi:hypothetical protein